MVGTFVGPLAKRCLLVVDLEVDPGWMYTINKSTAIQGYLNSANATFEAKYTVGEQTVSYLSPC